MVGQQKRLCRRGSEEIGWVGPQKLMCPDLLVLAHLDMLAQTNCSKARAQNKWLTSSDGCGFQGRARLPPYQQGSVEGWPQGCVLGRRLLLPQHTWGVLQIAVGLTWGRDGRDVGATSQTQTFSLEPLRAHKDTERNAERSLEPRLTDLQKRKFYRYSDHFIRYTPI